MTVGARQPSQSIATPDIPREPLPPIEPRVPAEQIVDDLRRGKTEALAEAVVPDQQVIDAAQRLGIDLNAEQKEKCYLWIDELHAVGVASEAVGVTLHRFGR